MPLCVDGPSPVSRRSNRLGALRGKGWADIEPGHPLMKALYDVCEVPRVPSIKFCGRSGRRKTHNTDRADGWEREGEADEFFARPDPMRTR
jgi:hypothetical protein